MLHNNREPAYDSNPVLGGLAVSCYSPSSGLPTCQTVGDRLAIRSLASCSSVVGSLHVELLLEEQERETLFSLFFFYLSEPLILLCDPPSALFTSKQTPFDPGKVANVA